MALTIAILLCALFPQPLYSISSLLGFETPSNFIFFIGLFFLLAISLSLSSIASKQAIMIKNLVQEQALLAKSWAQRTQIRSTPMRTTSPTTTPKSTLERPQQHMNETFCIFSAHYLPHVGGVEKYTQNLARELARRGDRVIIVTSNVYDLPERETLGERIEIARLPCYKLLGDRYPVTRHNKAYNRIMRYLHEQDIDYVTINTRFYRHTLEGIALAEAKGTGRSSSTTDRPT